jgi:hypothetical protein
MPALATVVSDYLTAVKDALTTGSDLGSNMRGAAQNYLRAQDMATVLELLQDALSQPAALTAVSGTTLSVTDGASTFDADSQNGNTVVFDGNTTAALAGVEAVVVDTTTDTLTFADYLPAAPAAGDTFTIRGTMFADGVDALREGKSLADAPAGDPYKANRVAVASLVRGLENLGSPAVERNIGWTSLTALAASTDTVVVLSDSGVEYRIDELRGMRLDVAAVGSAIVLSNEGNTVTLRNALPSAPAGGEAVTITVPVDDFGGNSAPKVVTHPGAQPGENAYLADLIDQLEAAVVAFTLPT